MLVKFKNGTEKKCSNPIEQKLFRSGVAAGWLCSFSLSEIVTSTELDALLTEENVSELTFCNDNSEALFTINEYTKVTSAVIRYTEDGSKVEIQLSKGI